MRNKLIYILKSIVYLVPYLYLIFLLEEHGGRLFDQPVSESVQNGVPATLPSTPVNDEMQYQYSSNEQAQKPIEVAPVPLDTKNKVAIACRNDLLVMEQKLASDPNSSEMLQRYQDMLEICKRSMDIAEQKKGE